LKNNGQATKQQEIQNKSLKRLPLRHRNSLAKMSINLSVLFSLYD